VNIDRYNKYETNKDNNYSTEDASSTSSSHPDLLLDDSINIKLEESNINFINYSKNNEENKDLS
jgi:hypothetical protein